MLNVIYGFKLTWHDAPDDKDFQLFAPPMDRHFVIGCNQYWTLNDKLFWVGLHPSKSSIEAEFGFGLTLFSPKGWQSSGDYILGAEFLETEVFEFQKTDFDRERGFYDIETFDEIADVCHSNKISLLCEQYKIDPSVWVIEVDD